MTVNDIKERVNAAKDLDFGTLFNESIDLFKKVWVQGLITVLLNMVMAIPVMMVLYIPMFLMGFFGAYTNSYDPYQTYADQDFSPIAIAVLIVLYLVVIAAMSAIGFGLKAAFYRICKLKDHEEMGKEDYFYFFKKPYLGKTITIGLAYMGISLLATLLCFIPLIYALVPLNYMFVLYAFNPDKSVSEIVNLSFEIGNKKWLISFGLLIVCGLLAGIVGMVLCFIGIYVTTAFSYLPIYLIYKEVVGFGQNSEVPRIEENSEN